MTAGSDIESDLRAMLARRGGDIDPATLDVPDVADLDLLRLVPVASPYRRRSPRLRSFGTIAVASVAAVAVFVVAIRATDDTPRVVNAGVATTLASPWGTLPVGFDPRTAGPFFSGEGTAEDVATAYLRDRLHAGSTPNVRVAALSAVDDVVSGTWRTAIRD